MSVTATTFQPGYFGRYFLVDKIATGGMAEIFKAKSVGEGGFENIVVIKRILRHLGEQSEFVSMFVEEARVTAALCHPNIIRVYDFGRVGSDYFMAMECVNGKDLLQVLKRMAQHRERFSVWLSVFIAAELCRGLHHAHTRVDVDGRPCNIVHRDISPANVLVSYEGDIKIADFGIAKGRHNRVTTQGGVFKGKYEYMSPEQAHGWEIDHRSDVFSVGIVLYELLTGKRAFRAQTDIATLEKIKSVRLPRPRRLNPQVSAELETVCMRALAKDRDERFQSAQEMYDALIEVLGTRSVDGIRRDLRDLMTSRFTREIESERTQLRVSSRAAAQLGSSMDHETSSGEPTTRTETLNVPHPPRAWDSPPPDRRAGEAVLLGGGLAVVLLILAVVVWGGVGPGWDAPRAGAIGFELEPKADVWIDGVFYGREHQFTVDHLAPGRHEVRLNAPGHLPLQEVVHIVEGGTMRYHRVLEAQPNPQQGDETSEQ